MTFAPNLVIHPTSRRLLANFVVSPGHGLTLHGEKGVGLTTIAREIARSINPTDATLVIDTIDGKDISIEQIRELYTLTRSVESVGRTVILDNAERLSLPAQNAFLKLLEEPPAHVHFILVAHELKTLLPTISSRCETIEVRLVTRNDFDDFLQSFGLDSLRCKQVAFLAAGRPALAKRLIDDDELFNRLADVTKDAREFIAASSYDRLLIAGKYTKHRDEAIMFAATVGSLLTIMLQKKPTQIMAQQSVYVSECIDSLYDNSNIRLQLVRLATAL